MTRAVYVQPTVTFVYPAQGTVSEETAIAGVSPRRYGGPDDPGATALTRIPREAYSIASERVTAANPPLVRATRADGRLLLGRSTTVRAVSAAAMPPDDQVVGLLDGARSSASCPRRRTRHQGIRLEIERDLSAGL